MDKQDGEIDVNIFNAEQIEDRNPIASSTMANEEQMRNLRIQEENIKWEKELIQRERELLNRERELLRQETNLTRNQGNETQLLISDTTERSLPEFDPGKKTSLTASQWIDKIENIASIFQWEHRVILYHAIGKLRGAAKYWFEGLQRQIVNWNDFKTMLKEGFPTVIDDADIHYELSSKKKKTDESYENYIYSMKAIASKGNITEPAIIKYIIGGIVDRDLARMLAVQKFETLHDLLYRIKSYEGTIRKKIEEIPNKKPSNSTQQRENKEFKCYNCNELGHKSIECPKPQKKSRCNNCQRVGHLEKDCTARKKENNQETETNRKKVNKIREEENVADEYHKTIDIDGKNMIGFIDLGSDVVTMRQDVAETFKIKYQPYEKQLRGFGNGSCRTIGKRNLIFTVDNVDIETDVIIVPNEAQEDALIVGRSALDQPGLKITKEENKLQIERIITRKPYDNEVEKKTSVQKIEEANEITPTADQIDDYEHLTEKQNNKLKEILTNYQCFAKSLKELGTTNLTTMKIEVTNNEPIKYRPYRIPYTQREKMDQMVQEMLDAEIIRESTSEYASPAILVGKKTGGERLCIDYRRLNQITKKEQVPMPLMNEQLDQLSGSKYFTTIDLAYGYYQVPLEENSKHLTAFVTTTGQYEFNKMPFGLVNAPSVFNRLMKKVVDRIGPRIVQVYMDDILIASKTIEEGLEKLEKVLRTLEEVGLKIKLNKCSFLQEQIDYLGFHIDREGIRPGKRKIDAIKNFNRPQNVHEIRQFIGLTSFFRKFIEGFAKMSQPLTKLTKQCEVFEWGEEQERAFQELKNRLIQEPVLAIYDPTAELEIHTDASKVGIAGILFQTTPTEKLKPVCYFSRQTTDTEAKYHSYELETLAVVESIERFRIYVLGRKFRVITDCNSLKTIMNRKDITPRIGRWWLKLQEYDFDLEHRPGVQMKHVDALSRNPTEDPREVDVADMKVRVLRITQDDWLLTMQMQDPKLKAIVEIVKKLPTTNAEKQVHADYELKNNRLYRKVGQDRRWVVPKEVIWRIIKGCHDEMGHYGIEKTKQNLEKNFWFPRMTKKVKNYISACVECAYHKVAGGRTEGEMHNIERIPVPFHTVNMDHMGPFPKSVNGNTHVLVYIDNFTKYVFLRAVKDTKTKSVLKILNDITEIFGCPKRIISDRGTAFTAKDFEKFCQDNDIVHIKNATATPRANGQVERYNKTIASAITTMHKDEQGKDWDKKLREIQFSLNYMKNKTTRKSPNELLFNYHPRNILQNKIVLALEDDEPGEIADTEKNKIEALKNIQKQQEQQKKRFDEKHKKPTKYDVGDLVLIKRDPVATGQPKKLAPRYKGPYQVERVLPNDRYLLIDVPGAEQTQRSFSSVFASEVIKPWCRLISDDEVEDDSSGSEDEL